MILIISFISYIIGYKNGQPDTYNSLLETGKTLEAENNLGGKWMIANPTRYKIGGYFLMFPKDIESNGSIAVFYDGGFPFFMAQDTDKNGAPNEFVIKDRQGKSIAATVDDHEYRVFDSSFSTVSGTPNLDAITYIDEDFDGMPDVRYCDEKGAVRIQ